MKKPVALTVPNNLTTDQRAVLDGCTDDVARRVLLALFEKARR